MAKRNRIVADQDFLHQQSQNLLSHRDIQHLGPNPQFGAKASQTLCQLEVPCFIHRRHLQRL
jgi:hypothetical protein